MNWNTFFGGPPLYSGIDVAKVVYLKKVILKVKYTHPTFSTETN